MAIDPNSMVTQINQSAQPPMQPAPQPQGQAGLESVAQQPQLESLRPPAPQPNHEVGKRLSASMNAMRDKALELGRHDLAKNYQDAGFQIRDRMYKEQLPAAQQVFAATGDIGGYIGLYNDTHDDGMNVQNHTKNADGTYTLQVRGYGGNAQTMQMTPDEVKAMIYQMNDPAARYAGEIESLKERNKKTFETDEKIREKKAEEAGKVQSVSQGTTLVKDGKEIYKNPKPTSGLDNVKSVSGGYMQDDGKGNLTFVATGKSKGGNSGDGSGDGEDGESSTGFGSSSALKPSERLAAYKNLSDIVEKRHGTINDETGKVSPNAKSIGVARRSERLFDANANIPPETLVTIAADGEDGVQIMQRPDGSKYEVPVIKYQDQFYKLGQGGQRESKEAPKPSAVKKAAQQVPTEDRAVPATQPNKPAPVKASAGLGSVPTKQGDGVKQMWNKGAGQLDGLDKDKLSLGNYKK